MHWPTDTSIHSPRPSRCCVFEETRWGHQPVTRKVYRTLDWLVLGEKERDRFSIKPGEVFKLNHVDPPLARLALGDERLRPVQGAGHFDLRQPGLMPSLPQPNKKSPVARRVR
jgi:hypothetical protein